MYRLFLHDERHGADDSPEECQFGREEQEADCSRSSDNMGDDGGMWESHDGKMWIDIVSCARLDYTSAYSRKEGVLV